MAVFSKNSRKIFLSKPCLLGALFLIAIVTIPVMGDYIECGPRPEPENEKVLTDGPPEYLCVKNYWNTKSRWRLANPKSDWDW